jgi:hypothetical protein
MSDLQQIKESTNGWSAFENGLHWEFDNKNVEVVCSPNGLIYTRYSVVVMDKDCKNYNQEDRTYEHVNDCLEYLFNKCGIERKKIVVKAPSKEDMIFNEIMDLSPVEMSRLVGKLLNK